MKKILWLTFLLVVSFSLETFAQQQKINCTQTLRLASATYDQGRLHEMEELLNPCLTSGGFTPTERTAAYRFLILAYIYLEEPEKADETMLKLLQTDHEFKPATVDPAEFIALWRTFRTQPVYRFGGKAGANMTIPFVVSSDNVNDGKSKYSAGYGFAVGPSAEIPFTAFKIKNRLTFNPELFFQITSFKYSNSDSVRTNSGPRSQTWITLPLTVQYSLRDNDDLARAKLNPYVGLGIETSYLLKSKTTGQATIKDNSSIEPKSYDVTANGNKLNFSGILSAGIKYKIGKGVAILEARYHYGLTNISKVGGTYANSFLVWDNHTTDAIYKINYTSITVGYLINIYHPKKLTIKK